MSKYLAIKEDGGMRLMEFFPTKNYHEWVLKGNISDYYLSGSGRGEMILTYYKGNCEELTAQEIRTTLIKIIFCANKEYFDHNYSIDLLHHFSKEASK
jgi:hypothetical protein